MIRLSLKKGLAALLALCILLSCAVIPTVAAEKAAADTATSSAPTAKILLNRDFDDRTVVNNGFGAIQVAGNTIKLAEENGNTYMHWIADSTEVTTTHGHFNIDVSTHLPEKGSLVLRATVRTTDVSSATRDVILARPYDYHHGADIKKPDGTPYGYNSGLNSMLRFSRMSVGGSYSAALRLVGTTNLYAAGEFVDVTFVYTWEDKTNVTVNAYYGNSTEPNETFKMVSYGVDARPCYFRFQVNGATGLSWDLDNLILYTVDTLDPAVALGINVHAGEKGVLYNHGAGKYVDPDAYLDHYFFKVGVERALDPDGVTVHDLGCEPFACDGEIYIPVAALEATVGTPISSYITYIDDIAAVEISDISAAYPGYYASYASLGLIAISEQENVFKYGSDDESLMAVMQKFIFEHMDSSLGKVEAFGVSGNEYTSHPYILANQDKFDSLHEIYLNADGKADPVHRSYIINRLNSAQTVYKNYANESGGKYSSLKTNVGLNAGQGNLNYMPFMSDDGYDIGGRLEEASSHNSNIMQLAYAYQITREEKYARLAYDYAIALGNWEHWGPGHFLNCADASAPYAIAYDWLYTIWQELGLDTGAIADIIFTHSLIPAYYSVHTKTIPEGWMRCISGVKTKSGWSFNTGSNNWNAVCSSGIVIASLALAGDRTDSTGVYIDTDVNTVAGEKSQLVTDLGDHTGLNCYQDYAVYLINQCFFGLEKYGLVQYMPDGSYIESPGYWSYGTNNLFEMVAAVTTATGYNTGVANDFGLLDAWGMDRTCYYAINSQSGDYKIWNYHDSGGGSAGAQDTSWFSFVASFTGDSDLAELRTLALASGKSGSPTLQDVLFYEQGDGEYKKPDLQYWMEGIHGYVVRDSWEAGSIYAGIMGDTNNIGHGQVDSGSFVYHNDGTIWFCDLGTENYNCYGFWGGATRYRYYKMNAEGNNTLFLANREDVPYGQSLYGFGTMTSTGANDYGAYALIDNTSVYGGHAISAMRGMLLTNDRRTVVIQDEVTFAEPETAYWVGHTEQQIILSVDRTVAYLYDGSSVVRVSILDNGAGLKFAIEDAYTFHLEASEGMDELAEEYFAAGTHEANYNRSSYKKLTIKCENVTSIKLAVVIEELPIGEISPLGYEWLPMDEWNESTPSADGSVIRESIGSFDADGEILGRIESSLSNLTMYEDKSSDGNVYVIGGSSSGSASSYVSFMAEDSLSEFGFLGDRIIVAEFDLSTYSSYPEGITLSLGRHGSEIISIPLEQIGSVAASQWKRVTIIIDGDDLSYYVYFGDVQVLGGSFAPTSCEDIGLIFSSREGSLSSGSILLDNLRLRAFGADYSRLDDVFAGGSIADWTDRAPIVESESNLLATVTYKESASLPGDTPIVDLYVTSYTTVGIAGTEGGVTVKEIYRWQDLSKYLVTGAVIELYATNTFDRITVTSPITVHRNGNRFNAVSPDYIAREDGDTLTYESGSITVTWITENGTVTEEYTSSVSAKFPGQLTASPIYEEKTERGYEYFVNDGWARTEGGEALDELDMIVTDAKTTFYRAKIAYNGLYVTVKDGTVTGYTNPNYFFSTVIRGSYDRISLVNDFAYNSTGISDSYGLTKTINLYLNGKTLIYKSTDSSDHMFTPTSGQLNIYGPGGITSEAANSNILYQSGAGSSYFENVTLDSPRAITDHREGYAEFKDCHVIIRKNTAAFGATNRNNAVTVLSRMPYVYINGCTIDMPAASNTQSVFTLTANARIEVGGGTVINRASGGYLFSLQNNTIGTVENYDYENAYPHMAARIGNVSHNCSKLATTSSNDPSGNKYEDMITKLEYVSGAVLDTEGGVGEDVRIADGFVAARSSAAGSSYVVTIITATAKVTWQVGGLSVVEYWLKGETPVPDSTAIQELLDTTAEDGRRYTFSTDTVHTDTEFVGIMATDFDILVNLTLHTSFTVNFYIEMVDGVEFTEFTIDGFSVIGSDTVIGGKRYIKLTAVKSDPARAAESIALNVIFNDNNRSILGASMSKKISIVGYADALISDDAQSYETRSLAANVLKYIEAAYVYTERTSAHEYSSLNNILDKHSKWATASSVEREVKDMSPLTVAINGSSLHLKHCPSFRFYLRDDFSGTVTVSYETLDRQSDGGYTVTRVFDNAEAKISAGRRYFELDMAPFDFAGDLSITVRFEGGEASGVYNLATYYHAISKELGATTNLINAIYAYTECARLYKMSIA